MTKPRGADDSGRLDQALTVFGVGLREPYGASRWRF
jgi:hypothetical protein